MSTDIFLGALLTLFFVAIAIFAMTANGGQRPRRDGKDKQGQ